MRQIKIIPILLFVNLVATTIIAIFGISIWIKIAHNQQETLVNQYANGQAEETFIREGLVCLFTTPPNSMPSKAQITTETNNCFKNTPPIK